MNYRIKGPAPLENTSSTTMRRGKSFSVMGFTLIELLVVIAIIGVLSSVVFTSLNTARGRANDAKTRSDLKQVQNALTLYFNQYGSYPPNPVSGTASLASTALQPLVTAGYIPAIPNSPNPAYPYYYYDYGTGNTIGVILTSQFTGTAPSTGYGGSCRPFASGTNFCDASSNTYYCLCLKY